MAKVRYYHAPSAVAGMFIGMALEQRAPMLLAIALAAGVLIVAAIWSRWREQEHAD